MMKRLVVILALILTVMAFLPSFASAMISSADIEGAVTTESLGDLTEDQAIAIAKEVLAPMLNRTNFTPQDISATLIASEVDGHRTWIVSFFEAGMPPPAGVCLVSSPSGEIIATTTANYLEIEDSLEQERGWRYFWSLNDQMVFDAIYKKPEEYPRSVLPSGDHIPQDEAYKIASEALRDEYGISGEMLRSLRASYSFILGPVASGENEEKWVVCFYSESANEHQATLSAITGEIELLYSNKDANS